MRYSPIALACLTLLATSSILPDAAAGLRDRDRAGPGERRGTDGIYDPRGVSDPRGANDPRADNMDDNRESRQDTMENNSDNRQDTRGEGGDEREDTLEQNQENRQETSDDAQQNREQGREEYAEELEDIGDDIRDGDEVLDNDPEFRGDRDGLIDGDGFESDDNDFLKAMAIGSRRTTLPENAQPQSVNGSDYYFDGTNWYQPVTTASGTTYEIVPAPAN